MRGDSRIHAARPFEEVGVWPAGEYASNDAMPEAWSIFCDGPELAVDLTRDAKRIGLSISPEVRDEPWRAAIEALESGAKAAVAVSDALPADAAVELAAAGDATGRRVPVAVIGPQRLGVLHDLGLPAVHETGPLAAVAALSDLGSERPWAAATKELPAVDRVRLGERLWQGDLFPMFVN